MIFCTPIFGDFLFPKYCLQMDRCRPSSFPSFSPRRNDDALLFLFPFFLWCVPMQHGRRRRKRDGSNNAEKTNIFPNGYIKNIGACFYTYMTVRMFFILSKTATEPQEQQEVSRSRRRERSINQTRSGLPPFLLVPYFCVCARHISFSPKKGNFHLVASSPPDIENNNNEGSSIKRVRNIQRFRTKLFPLFF